MAKRSSLASLLKLCTYNVKGLNNESKRGQILYSLHKAKADIILLQETHFCTESIPVCSGKHYFQWFHSTMSGSKARGVSIAFHKKHLEHIADINGRYLLLKFRSPIFIF